PPIATAVAGTSSVSRGGGGLIGDRARVLNRHPGDGRGPWRYPKEIGTFGPDIAAHRPRSAGLSVPARVSPAARWTPAFAGVTEGSCRRQRLTGVPSRPPPGYGEARAAGAAILV